MSTIFDSYHDRFLDVFMFWSQFNSPKQYIFQLCVSDKWIRLKQYTMIPWGFIIYYHSWMKTAIWEYTLIHADGYVMLLASFHLARRWRFTSLRFFTSNTVTGTAPLEWLFKDASPGRRFWSFSSVHSSTTPFRPHQCYPKGSIAILLTPIGCRCCQDELSTVSLCLR